jgi:hypothetical protein
MFLGCLNVSILGKTLFNQLSTSLVDFQGTIYRCNILFWKLCKLRWKWLDSSLHFLTTGNLTLPWIGRLCSRKESSWQTTVSLTIFWIEVLSILVECCKIYEVCTTKTLFCTNYLVQISTDWNKARWNENGCARKKCIEIKSQCLSAVTLRCTFRCQCNKLLLFPDNILQPTMVYGTSLSNSLERHHNLSKD